MIELIRRQSGVALRAFDLTRGARDLLVGRFCSQHLARNSSTSICRSRRVSTVGCTRIDRTAGWFCSGAQMVSGIEYLKIDGAGLHSCREPGLFDVHTFHSLRRADTVAEVAPTSFRRMASNAASSAALRGGRTRCQARDRPGDAAGGGGLTHGATMRDSGLSERGRDSITSCGRCNQLFWGAAMGRRSEKLLTQDTPGTGMEDGKVIQVVSRAFDILRCFENRSMRLGNGEIADRCGLPRSTVSRLTLTLTRIGQLSYLPQELKYALGPHAIALGTSLFAETRDKPACTGEQDVHKSASVHIAEDQLVL